MPSSSAVSASTSAGRLRAQPMAPEQRRAMIAEQAVPMLLERGPALSTRELAERLGIAEGTIFRAFGDKDALVDASMKAFAAAARERMAAGLVDPGLPLEEKVAAIVAGSRAWMQDVVRLRALVGREKVPRYLGGPGEDPFRAALAHAFAPEAEKLGVPLDHLVSLIRLATMAAAVPDDLVAPVQDADLVRFILYGVAGRPRTEEG